MGKVSSFVTDETIAIAIAVLTLIIPVDAKNGIMILQGKEAFLQMLLGQQCFYWQVQW